MLVMCQCRFIDCTNVDNGADVDCRGTYVGEGAGGKWEISEFCCESGTALKNKVF